MSGLGKSIQVSNYMLNNNRQTVHTVRRQFSSRIGKLNQTPLRFHLK